ncbi:hypothetical protein FACS189425_00880 [Clostridia bacterium]|nr:hypothetical protein FACS189425_00880 [Clostridia bacterium]
MNKQTVYGFGERFDALNQIGLVRDIEVVEKFTNQGASTYLPVPFCLTGDGIGFYVETPAVCKIHTFHGTPSEILDAFTARTGRPKLPPDWAFGLWNSGNRWSTQAIVEEQVAKAIEHGMKPSVVVIEAWSDETTFYRFDTERFPDSEGMIAGLHALGIRVLLWQICVLKDERDGAYAEERGFVVKNADGSTYRIPEGEWFGGCRVPDFNNPEACKWWFGNRQYLLDMGVDGFKTDGGECVDNLYAASYTRAYSEFVGDNRVLFSRAGFTGSQATTLHWAGDQVSTWAELRHVLTAGLNAGLSGIAFWGFDIAGFAGALPSDELYLRAFAIAAFAPITQWHSEPPGGQFAEILASDDAVNDRSPWNIALRSGNAAVIELCRKFVREREKLTPYILSEAKYCSETGRPLMAALVFDFYDDAAAREIDDEYMFGRELLVAPVISEGAEARDVYLPQGAWSDFWTGELFEGGRTINVACGFDTIPVFKKQA